MKREEVSDPMSERFVEYYEWRVRRGMIDLDVAEMLIATHLEGVRQRRRGLADVPRPKPAKHRGFVVAQGPASRRSAAGASP